MKSVVTVREAAAGISLAYLPIKAASASSIDVCDHAPHTLPKMEDQESFTLRCRSFSRWGRKHVTFILAYRGGQYFDYV